MRAFLQKKAGATYFRSSNLTLSVRKDGLEFIFALKGGWHAVVNIVIDPDNIIIFANLGDFSDKLDEALPKVSFLQGEMPTLTGLLQGKTEFKIFQIDPDGKGLASGVGTTIPNPHKDHLKVIGDPKVLETASRLVNQMLTLYQELSRTEKAPLKPLADTFYDR